MLARRALLAAALTARAWPPRPASGAEWSVKLPEDRTLYARDRAPCLNTRLEGINLGPKHDTSLADFLSAGKYVVLWFYPENDAANNELEALNFQRALAEFSDLDTVLLGCSAQTVARIKSTLVNKQQLTIPFVSDPRLELIRAYGANNAVGETFRQSFILDPAGEVRWIERNIQFGVGNFDLQNHASRVLRECYRVRNGDGWAV